MAGKAVSRPNFPEMQKLNIIAKSASKCDDIGAILLNDEDGTLVGNMRAVARGDEQKTVRAIYKQWMQEDEDCSWAKLAWCFRRVSLNPLAAVIEQHFGLPKQTQEDAPGSGVGTAAATSTPANTGPSPSVIVRDAPDGTFHLRFRGLAVLVTCDYVDAGLEGVTPLPETNVDAERMKETFEQFKYDIHQLRNKDATKPKLTTLLEQISRYLNQYSGGDVNEDGGKKVIIFAFSGHGTSRGKDEDQIKTQDGKLLSLMEEVVYPLVRRSPVKIPKLFFIDACRGSDHLERRRVTTAPPVSGSAAGTGKGPGVSKGVREVETNYRIDYATIPGHKSYTDGVYKSAWMPKLAYQLRERDDTYSNIIDLVNQEVGQQEGLQQPEIKGRLNVGLLKLYYKEE